jgi:exopolysaccharide biosynthesis polyprenyl glycosylphosphotransferase
MHPGQAATPGGKSHYAQERGRAKESRQIGLGLTADPVSTKKKSAPCEHGTDVGNRVAIETDQLKPMPVPATGYLARTVPATTQAKFPTPDFLLWVAILGDLVAIVAGLCLGYWIRFTSGWITFGVEAPDIVFENYFGLIVIGTAFLLGAFGYLQLYDVRHLLRFRRVVTILARGATFWLFAYLGMSLALKFEPPISRIYVVCSYLSALTVLLVWRWAFHACLRTESLARRLRQRVVFVGWSEEGERMARAIANDKFHPYDVLGWVPSSANGLRPPPDVLRLGDSNALPDLLKTDSVDIVILADSDPAREDVLSLSALCEKQFVQFKVIPSYFQILISGLQLQTISGVPILGVSQLPLDRLFNRALKRCVDLVGAVVGLLVSMPLMAICGALIYIESPGPILYRQMRVGKNGKTFWIIKLRSMRLDAEAEGGAQWAKKADPRRLRIGAFMREWNLDEVPQFWNVLLGEMTLVGPRPERPELIAAFQEQIPHYNARHSSRPGITGWAQVNGLRGDTSLTERVRYDLYYLENWSLWLDLQIMAQTFLKRDNAY